MPQERLVLVPNGVDRQRVRSLPPGLGENLRRRHGLLDAPLVVYVGSLSLANHAVDLPLDGFSLAARQRPLRLALVGGGGDAAPCRVQAARLGIEDSTLFGGRWGQRRHWAGCGPLTCRWTRPAMTLPTGPEPPSSWSSAVGIPTLTSDVGDRRVTLGGGTAGYFVAPDGRGPGRASLRR